MHTHLLSLIFLCVLFREINSLTKESPEDMNPLGWAGWAQGARAQGALGGTGRVCPPQGWQKREEVSLHDQVKAAACNGDGYFQPLERAEVLTNCCGVLQLEIIRR